MSTVSNTSKRERGRVEMLDLLRMLAVLAVILFHYAFRGAAADGFTDISLPDLVPYAKYGYLGVQLFFAISGFVIAYSADGRTAMGFAIARISRIYPGFLFCMTATFLVTVLIGAPRFETGITQWLANLFIVAPALKQPFMDGAYWSIVYEITFYGWIFLLLAFGIFRRDGDCVVIAWLAISILNETLLHSGVLQRLFVTSDSAFFCAGLVLYEMHAGRRDRALRLLLALTTVTAMLQAISGANWLRSHYGVDLDNRVLALAPVVAIALVALASRVRRMPLPAGVLLAIGGLTYPLYLLHQHIGFMLMNKAAHLAPPSVVIGAVIATMIGSSLLVWYAVERPAQRFTKAVLTGAWEHLSSVGRAIRARLRPQRA